MFMDCLCIPEGQPASELTYKMISHIIRPDPQKVFATSRARASPI
jgi:hypothetical protein